MSSYGAAEWNKVGGKRRISESRKDERKEAPKRQSISRMQQKFDIQVRESSKQLSRGSNAGKKPIAPASCSGSSKRLSTKSKSDKSIKGGNKWKMKKYDNVQSKIRQQAQQDRLAFQMRSKEQFKKKEIPVEIYLPAQNVSVNTFEKSSKEKFNNFSKRSQHLEVLDYLTDEGASKNRESEYQTMELAFSNTTIMDKINSGGGSIGDIQHRGKVKGIHINSSESSGNRRFNTFRPHQNLGSIQEEKNRKMEELEDHLNSTSKKTNTKVEYSQDYNSGQIKPKELQSDRQEIGGYIKFTHPEPTPNIVKKNFEDISIKERSYIYQKEIFPPTNLSSIQKKNNAETVNSSLIMTQLNSPSEKFKDFKNFNKNNHQKLQSKIIEKNSNKFQKFEHKHRTEEVMELAEPRLSAYDEKLLISDSRRESVITRTEDVYGETGSQTGLLDIASKIINSSILKKFQTFEESSKRGDIGQLDSYERRQELMPSSVEVERFVNVRTKGRAEDKSDKYKGYGDVGKFENIRGKSFMKSDGFSRTSASEYTQENRFDKTYGSIGSRVVGGIDDSRFSRTDQFEKFGTNRTNERLSDPYGHEFGRESGYGFDNTSRTSSQFSEFVPGEEMKSNKNP